MLKTSAFIIKFLKQKLRKKVFFSIFIGMRKIYLLLLFITSFLFGQDSQLYYSGIFLNPKNKPQNFLKVYNKNSGIYELTDEEGFAIIAAKRYDTLVWNNGKNTMVVYGSMELKDILRNRTERKSVEDINNKAYDSLIAKKSNDKYSIENSFQLLTKNSDRGFSSVRKLKSKDTDIYKLKRQAEKQLIFNGSFTTSFDIKSRNSIPRVQNQYVQGRSENGTLTWRGPETNEMFSFGPDISTLGYDNQPYEFDRNGRLVSLSDADFAAKAYHNDIFKTTVGYNNQLRINSVLKSGYTEKTRLSIELGQQKDQMYFSDQYDIINSIKTKLNKKFLGADLNFVMNYEENKATNSNRIGLFTRAYQNSLLTPISFSNTQGIYLINGRQRSYSQLADNPGFLMEQKNKYNYRDSKRRFSFDVTRNWSDFKFNLSQSYENNDFYNIDSFKPSAYVFFDGIKNERNQKNTSYNTNAFVSYEFGNVWRHLFSTNFIINDRTSEIHNSMNNRKYLYQRTSQDYLFGYKLDYDGYDDFGMGINVGNSFYISNTSAKNNFWLPKANVYMNFENIFDWYSSDLKIVGAYTLLNSEPDITNSYASYSTILLNAEDAHQYFPVQEVETFRNLSNIHIKEWKAGFRFSKAYKISVEGEYFNRKILDDIFPVFENDQLKLKNIADHTYSGYELSFSYGNLYLGEDFTTTQKITFFKYKDVVDKVRDNYNNLAVSGFKDIYKSLTENQVLGAVMGSYFERNSSGELIIDENGYPVKAAGLKMIADPTPDFIMKFNHNFYYKMFSLDINWEWKKGGQLWNGTQAVLDYYGRSQTSAEERNVENYIFQGVNSNGNINQIPVDFYNSNQNISENRWVRYGYLGVAEDYVQKADYIRISNISLTAKLDVGNFKRSLGITFYVNNILLWQTNKGADPNQNFYDLDNGRGLDFFNLPSYKTFGCMVSFQF